MEGWLTAQAIQQMQGARVDPDLWKSEGLDRHEHRESVAGARRNGRDKIGSIILGRGEDARKVREWLTTAAGIPGFIGFAVGRTVIWEPLAKSRAKNITCESGVAEIGRRYREFVDIFENARAFENAHAL